MENGYFTRSFIKPVIQSWLTSMDCCQLSKKDNRLYIGFKTDKVDANGTTLARVGIVQFYDKSIKDMERNADYVDMMELSIYEDIPASDDKDASLSAYIDENGLSPIFWLHFGMVDFEFVMEQLSDFFKCIYQTDRSNLVQDPKGFNEIKNILICCTAGVTSGYFAGMMQQKVDQDYPNSGIHINNCNVNFLDDVIQDYDIVLIAPQIGYMEKELKEKYGEKIQKIDRVDFATFNFEHVLEKLINQK